MNEYGFYNSIDGYWQVVGDSRSITELLQSYPEGTTQVPLKPSGNHTWNGTDWVYNEPTPLASEVDVERDVRIIEHFIFNDTAFQLDQISQNRITVMGADARFAILSGAQENDLRWADPDTDFCWIATDNSVIPMDAQTMSAFSDAAKLWVVRHTFAARELKNMDPIPTDYKDDKWWPE